MEEYAPNSHASKEQKPLVDKPAPVQKKVSPVVSGTAKIKKKSEGRKILDIFLPEDINSVKTYVVYDILVPAVKRFLSDSVDAFLYPGGDNPRRKATASKISYTNYYGRDRDRDRRSDPPSRVRSGIDYDDIEFETRGDAEAVLTAMDDIIDTFDMVSIADFYDLAEVSTNNYNLNKYGWNDIRRAEIVRLRNGSYVIKFPKPLPIDQF